MAPFNKDQKFGPRRPSATHSGQRFGSHGKFGQKELFDAECNSCHKSCQVPFRPNGKKPVYCRDCFTPDETRDVRPQGTRFKQHDARQQRSFAQPAPATPDPRIDSLKRQLDTIQASLEKLIATVESGNRTAALAKEVRKYVPAAKPAEASARKGFTKKVSSSVAAKATKVATKRAAKSQKD